MPTEESMGILLQQSGQSVFGKLYDTYAPALLGVIRRIVDNNKVAEDVLQMSFIEIWENKKTYDPARERLFTWMLRIARNAALGIIRTAQDDVGKTPGNDNYVAEGGSDDQAPGANRDDLKGEQMTALNLVYFRGYTFAEAAGKLNIPVDTCKRMVIGAIKNLKQMVVA